MDPTHLVHVMGVGVPPTHGSRPRPIPSTSPRASEIPDLSQSAADHTVDMLPIGAHPSATIADVLVVRQHASATLPSRDMLD